jgi:inositol monophosphatase 3
MKKYNQISSSAGGQQSCIPMRHTKLKYILASIIIFAVFLSITKYLNNGLEAKESQELRDYSMNVVKSARPSRINLNELFHFGQCLLREAGKRIVTIRKNTDLNINHKKDKSVVTKADLESHTIIVHTLEHKFQSLNIHSEENSVNDENFNLNYFMNLCDNYEKKSSDIYAPLNNIQVWIDPLDATQEYSGKLKVSRS